MHDKNSLEPVTRLGRQPLRVLVHSGSIGNCIDAQDGATQGLKVEAKDQVKELKTVDGTMLRMEERVEFTLKCDAYKGAISAWVSQYKQTDDFGNPTGF